MSRIKARDTRNLFFRKGTWWVDIQVRGQRVREKAGATEAQARHYRDALRAWGRDSARGLPSRRPEGIPIKFEDFAADYLKLYARQKRSCSRDAISIAHLGKFFAGTLLKDINAESVDRYRASRTTVSTATVNRELACFRTMLYLAVRYGRISSYPLPAKRLLKKEPEFKPRILELDEAKKLVAAAGPGLMRDAMTVFLGTGLRRRELLELRRQDVDFSRAELTITADRAKNGKSRTIYLGPRELEILRSRPGTEYFFENPDTGRPITQVDNLWKRVKTAAGIKGRLRIHDLRDSHATWQLRSGIDIRTISEQIGDSPEVALKRYCHTDARTMKAAVRNLPDLSSPEVPIAEALA